MRAALLCFAALALAGVLLRPALPVDETRYLTVAWEMRLSGDWLVPHLNGLPYSDKPPLLFWLINLVWLVTGPSEVAARLIGPAFGLLSIAATGRLAARLHPGWPGAADAAARALAGMLGFAVFAGLTMFDTMLTLATVLGVSALLRGRWVAFGLCLGFGVLAKGPVILILLIPTALAMPLWAGLGARRLLAGLAIALGVGAAVVALWLGPALAAADPGWRAAVLWRQSAGRMVSSFAHQRPFWFVLAVLPLLTWPWSWSPAIWRAARFPGPLPVWIGATVLAFGLISGKQAHYLLPVLPAFAIAFAPGLRRDVPWAALLPLALGAAVLVKAPWPMTAAMLLLGAVCAVRAAAWAAPVVVLALDALFLGPLGTEYDAGLVARRLAPHEPAGIGILDDKYAGQFGFAGRLTRPLAVLPGAAEAEAWLAPCSGRVLVVPGPGTGFGGLTLRPAPCLR